MLYGLEDTFGWSLESVGPWTAHPNALVSISSISYATAFTTYVLQQVGISSARALEWLKSHQDPQSGTWPAVSMNKRYPVGSMEEKFLQDAATAFAALALIEAGQ
jgi:squalene-hopene/tetraprenyl-beta-curcumene cyclase